MAAQANIKAVITAEDRASKTLNNFQGNVEKANNGLIAGASKLKSVLAAAAVAAVTAAAAIGVKTSAQLETARQGFVTLLGSAQEADKIMRRIRDEARRTPFEITGLTEATQMLAAVTKSGDRALDFILDIGESLAALGRGQPELDRISVNLQQIAATGRAFSIDIKQFAFAGIPIFEMLQKETGKTGEALDKFIEDGGVTFDLLEKMFKNATDEGGRFFGAYENQAGTFAQVTSNLKDSFSIFLSDIVNGTGLFDLLKNAMKKASDILLALPGFFSRVGDVLVKYLGPSFQALFNTLQQQVLPQLRKIKDALEPGLSESLKLLAKVALPAIIVALKMFIDAQNLAWKVLGFGVNIQAKLITFFGRLAGAGINAARSLYNVWRSVFNGIADAWNRTVGRLSFKVPGWVPGVGGKGFDVPDIPRLAEGGIVTKPTIAMIGEKGPEAVVPLNKSNAVTPNITINIGLYAGSEMEKRKVATELHKALQDAMGAGWRMA